MKDAKVITICGSLKFQKEIMKVSEQLELEGNCVLSIIYPTGEVKDKFTKEEIQLLGELHKQKIRMSDAIFVVNVNGYIGDGVKKEIEYANSLEKEILYLENKINNER